jgi:PAS domain S-box-containing protein
LATPPPDPSLRLAAIVESSDDAIVSKDLNGVITSWNHGAELLFGYPAEEAIGRSITILIPPDRLSEEDLVLSRIRRGERVEHFETVRVRKDSRLVNVSLTVSPIRDAGGTVVGASKIARDISDRNEAEARATFLAEAGTALSASLDYETTLKAVTRLAVPAIADWCVVDILGENGRIERVAVAHVDEAKIRLAVELAEKFPAAPDSRGGVHEVLRTGRPTFMSRIPAELLAAAARNDEHRQLLSDLKLNSYMCMPMIAQGKPFGAITFVYAESRREYSEQDLTFARELANRASLAVENARSYARATQASQLKDEFLATLSHELRTPLNSVLGYARMLQSGLLPDDQTKHAIDVIERNGRALKQIIEDVLDVSRIVAGRLRLNVEAVDLPLILKDSVATVMPAADAKHVKIETLIDPSASPVSGDRDRLQQIVWNLLSNAIKFTPKNGKVQLRLSAVNSHVEVSVSDTGRGIAPEFLPFVFERFRQSDASFSREHGGLGLGLAIAKELAELHGGTMRATSDGPGHGATFVLTLPRMIVHGPKFPRDYNEHPHREGAAPRLDPMPRLDGLHVIAVDDEFDSLNLLTSALEAAGATVVTFSSAADALAGIRDRRVDVVIADIGMPGMDGLQFIRAVRQLEGPVARTPAAALTAYARSQDRVTSLSAGFQMHLVKPVDPVELVLAVSTLAATRPS